MKTTKKIIALALALVLTISLVPLSQVSAARKMKLNKTKATIYVGKTVKLKVKYNKTGKKVKWKSKNKKIAKVSKKGKVTAKKPGKTTIIAKVGKKKFKCKITVKKKKTTNNKPATTIAPEISVEQVVTTEAPTKPVVPTEPSTSVEPTVTTEAPTTTANQQETTVGGQQQTTNQPTTASGFTTDSSIAKPFGMVVNSPENGMVSVVWGRGSIDCYNVYVDGERRRTAVQAQQLLLPVYFEGTHTISVTTVVGNRESEKTSMTIAVTGVGERETEPETCPPELVPQLREDIPLRNDRILMQLNNKTEGQYSDSEIYWCLVGYNSNKQLCYLDKDGNLIPASTDLNTLKVSGRDVADVSYTLEEADHVYVPSIVSGRMFISYEKPIYLTFQKAADGNMGFAGPDINNPTDPNANTLFEFAEFTIDGKYFWGNTTRVDYFSFPMVTRLVGDYYDRVVGDIGTRDEIFAAFKENAPEPFKTLVGDKRIVAPCKGAFNEGKTYGNYFDSYINEFWTKYASEDLVFTIDGITYTGRSNGNVMNFTRPGDSTVYTVSKPTTQEVLEGKGAFARGNAVELVIESELCAAFNRGVATEPSKWRKAAEYYKNDINNYYAGFFHEHSIVGRAYGFCYDDVNDQSTLLQHNKSDALIIDLKW